MVRTTTDEAVEEGDTIEWSYGTGTIGRGRASGVVLATGLSKFGYDDVIEVDAGDHITHVRPKDLV